MVGKSSGWDESMKVSEWLRQYQLTGEVPELADSEYRTSMAFWCGWLIGPSHSQTAVTMDDRREMAIRAAEFIELRAKG